MVAVDAVVAEVAVKALPYKLPVIDNPVISAPEPVPKAWYNCAISEASIVLPFITFDGSKVAIYYFSL